MAESNFTTTEPSGAAAQKLEPSLDAQKADEQAAAVPALEEAQPAQSAPKDGFGEKLRAAREAGGISVGDMAVQCRLSVAQIRALEEEDLEHLPEPVYVRAFIRGYAHAVKLDPTPLVDDYMTRYGRRGATVEVGQLPNRAPATEAVFHEQPKNRTLKGVLIAVLAALVAGGIWAVYTDQFASLHTSSEAQKIETGANEAADAKTTPAAEPAKTEANAAAPKAEVKPEPAPAPAPEAQAKTEAPAPAVQPAQASQTAQALANSQQPAQTAQNEPAAPAPVLHKVEFRLGGGSSWVQVIAPNGRNVVASELKAQSSQTFEIPKGARFTIGNAGVVSLAIDGEVYPLDGVVRNGIARFTIE